MYSRYSATQTLKFILGSLIRSFGQFMNVIFLREWPIGQQQLPHHLKQDRQEP
jgi:hypothetical protein